MGVVLSGRDGDIEAMPKLHPKSVEFSRKLRKSMTDAERALWRELRLGQTGFKFRRQHPVGQYIVDFASVEARLCIEVDGAQHAQAQRYDEARTRFLEGEGYRVVRFTDREVLTAMDSVKQAVWNALQETKPPPP